MSLEKSMYVKQIDPAIDLTRPVKIRIEEGAQTVTQTKYSASSLSQQNIQFNNINPPSAEIIVDRKIFVRAAFRLTFTATSVPIGEYLFQTDGIGISGGSTDFYKGGLTGGVDGLRAFPLSQMLQSLVLKMNSQNFTQNINNYIEPLMRFSNYRDVGEEDWSMTPTMQDEYQQYSDFITYGSSRNVLGNYGEDQFRTPRGGFASLQVVDQFEQGSTSGAPSTGLGNNQIAYVDFEVCEPLFISPAAFGKATPRGFLGIKTMSVTLNFDSQYFNYVWSHDATSSGKDITNITLGFDVSTEGFVSRPEIMLTYYTPRFSARLPKDNIYPYHDITDYITELSGVVSPGANQQLTISNIQLDSVPKRAYIFVREKSADKTFNSTDTYARIKEVNLTFANTAGILSDANEKQLYLLSVNNGLKSSWSQWSRHIGSVLCLDFARQISLTNKNVVGKNGQYQLQCKMLIQNLSTTPKAYDVHVAIVSDGYLDIMDQSIDRHTNLGSISDDIYDSELIHTIDWEDFESFYGAGIADRLRSLGKKLKPIGKKVLSEGKDLAVSLAKQYGPDVANLALSEIPGIGPELGQAAEIALRSLASGEIDGKEYDKRLKAAYQSFGLGVVGGRPATKKAMQKRLKRY